jgi:hypothetical protein
MDVGADASALFPNMKIPTRPPLALVYLCFVASVGVSNSAHAGNATWNLNPSSVDWNTATNWTPAIVPNGAGDNTTFGLTNTPNISISTDTLVDSITFTTAAANNPYTIMPNAGVTLTLTGAGVVNNSGRVQNFGYYTGNIVFRNRASAGDGLTSSRRNNSTISSMK